MCELRKYRRRDKVLVTAVKIDLDTNGFTYRKWGETQTARAGDWLVCNNGDVYTVDRAVFERTYAEVSLGVYQKIVPVWAKLAQTDGKVRSTSGITNYQAGDMIVFMNIDELDGWAMNTEEFTRLYQLDD